MLLGASSVIAIVVRVGSGGRVRSLDTSLGAWETFKWRGREAGRCLVEIRGRAARTQKQHSGTKGHPEDSRGTETGDLGHGFRAEADSHIQREINEHYPLTCVRNGIE